MSTKAANNNPESLSANDWLALMKIVELKAELVLHRVKNFMHMKKSLTKKNVFNLPHIF